MIKSKEIKQIARTKLSGKWGKAFAMTALFFIINTILSYCTTFISNLSTDTKIVYYLAEFIELLLLLPLSYGITSALIKLINDKNPEYTTFINDTLLNFSKTIEMFFRIFLKMLVPSILVVIVAVWVYAGGIYWINSVTSLTEKTNNMLDSLPIIIIIMMFFILCAFSIAIPIISLPYSLSTYALAKNNELSAKESVNKSISLMKGNKWNFVKLNLSFLGWILLLFVLTFLSKKYLPLIIATQTSAVVDLIRYAGLCLLLPYTTTSISVFYDEVNNVKIETIDLEK